MKPFGLTSLGLAVILVLCFLMGAVLLSGEIAEAIAYKAYPDAHYEDGKWVE